MLKGETDITSEYAASAFVWTRDTGNAATDATWNAAHNGVKEFAVSAADLTENVKLTCTLTGTSPDYGTVYVDEDMNLIHAPAEADAEDTLHLENGILSVETEGNEYRLNGNVLGVIRHRLNGSVTAEAWVYTAAPEKLVEFKYDTNGLRTQKKVTDHGQVVTTEYIYHGKKLVGLTCGDDTLHFFYDAQGRPAQVKYGIETYNYVYNSQGDIVGSVNACGEYNAQFQYNGWGKNLTKIIQSQETCSALNPFRFRAYVYDSETRLYWLESRYYDPDCQRFINADTIIVLTSRVDRGNLFTYCGNKPISYSDPNGHLPVVAFALAGSGKELIVSGVMIIVAALGLPRAQESLNGIGQLFWPKPVSIPEFHVSSVYKDITKYTELKIKEIAESYGRYECEDAARSVSDYLTREGQKHNLVTLHFHNAYRGMVVSLDDPNTAISENGHHVGIEYNGKVYCNIYPGGLPYDTWVSRFCAADEVTLQDIEPVVSVTPII